MPIPVVTVAQMQALEDASARAGVSRDTLMENAGLACARHIRQHLGGIAGRRILALIGPGSNGADGLVIARRLAQWGANAHCCILHTRPDADPKMDAARAAGVTIDDAASDPDQSRLTARLTHCDAIIDAILGAGRYRPPQDAIAKAINLVNHSRSRNRPVFAIDLPTGVHPDTAAVANPTIIADETLALACPKHGIAHFPGAGRAGRITVLDIGLPPTTIDAANLTTHWMDDALPPTVVDAASLTTHRMDDALPPTVVDAASLTTHWMDDALASTLLPPRPPDAHKGTFGHLLIIAGSRHYIGAAALAAIAAHRAGAGLVTLATPASIYPIVAARLTETIHLPLPESADGGIAPSAARIIRQRLPAYDALAVGCGMGASPAAATFLRQLLQEIASANTNTSADAGASPDANTDDDTRAGANTGTSPDANTDDDTRADANAGANTGTSPDADANTDDDTRSCANANARTDAGALASPLPLIIDADGLNNLARIADWPALLHNIPTVLTPHPGEMATLTGRAVPDIQSHRPTVAARYAAQWKQTILLKGAHTIVATPTATPDTAGLAANLAVSPDTAGSGSDAAAGSNTGAGTAAGSDTAGLAASIAAGPDAAGSGSDAAPGSNTGAGTSASPDNAGLAASIAAGPDSARAGHDTTPGSNTGAGTAASSDNAGLAASIAAGPDAAGSGSDAALGSNTGAGTAAGPDNAGIAVSPDAAGPDSSAGSNTSIIAGPNTNTDADVRQRILPFANPALAAGGAGDVLTGIIGALLAQGLPPYDAAALAGYLHGTAGEHARRRHGDAGVIASDLPPLLPSIIQDLRAALPKMV